MNLIRRGGTLLLAVPVGRERIEFNAHRVFYPDTIVDCAAKLGLRLESLYIFTDDKEFLEVVDVSKLTSFNDQVYACGCFKFNLDA